MKNRPKTGNHAAEKRGTAFVVASLVEVARFAGVSTTTVRKEWVSRGMPGEAGAYPLDQIFQWRVKYERDRADEKRSALKDALAAEKLQRDRLQTRREALRLQREEGTLIKRAGIELYISEFNTRFGDWCDQVPDIIARLLPPKWQKPLRDALKQEFESRRVAMRAELEAKAQELDKSEASQD